MKRGFLSALSPQSRGFVHVASCHQFLISEFDESTLRVSIPTSIDDDAAAASSVFRPHVPLLSNPNHLPLPLHGNHPTPSDDCTTISVFLNLEDEEDDDLEDEEDDELPDAFDELFCEDLLFESLEIYFSEGFNRLVEESYSTTSFFATNTTTYQTSPPNFLAKEESPLEIIPLPPTNKSKSDMGIVGLGKLPNYPSIPQTQSPTTFFKGSIASLKPEKTDLEKIQTKPTSKNPDLEKIQTKPTSKNPDLEKILWETFDNLFNEGFKELVTETLLVETFDCSVNEGFKILVEETIIFDIFENVFREGVKTLAAETLFLESLNNYVNGGLKNLVEEGVLIEAFDSSFYEAVKSLVDNIFPSSEFDDSHQQLVVRELKPLDTAVEYVEESPMMKQRVVEPPPFLMEQPLKKEGESYLIDPGIIVTCKKVFVSWHQKLSQDWVPDFLLLSGDCLKNKDISLDSHPWCIPWDDGKFATKWEVRIIWLVWNFVDM